MKTKKKKKERRNETKLETSKEAAAKGHEVTHCGCTFLWNVSKSTLQPFSILAPYFSVLLIYRFIVRQPSADTTAKTCHL